MVEKYGIRDDFLWKAVTMMNRRFSYIMALGVRLVRCDQVVPKVYGANNMQMISL